MQNIKKMFERAEYLMHGKQYLKAEKILRSILKVVPEHVASLNNLGLLGYFAGQHVSAEELLREALLLEPDSNVIKHNLAAALRSQGKLSEALLFYEDILEDKQLRDNADLFGNVANLYRDLGRTKEALYYYDKALTYAPEQPNICFNRALLYLLTGHWQQGLTDYEMRKKREGKNVFVGLEIEKLFPVWCGESLAGKTILLYDEQGLGDCIHFLRYIKYLHVMDAKIILAVKPKLVDICSGYAERVLVNNIDTLRHCEADFAAALMSIPYILQLWDRKEAELYCNTPYLLADTQRAEKWADCLREAKMKIGIVWHGNPTNDNDINRSIPLEKLAPLAMFQNRACFYSLQLPSTSSAGKYYLGDLEVTDLMIDVDNLCDTAAIIANLDLVITVDTCVAHIAGALGKETFLLLSTASDWRWGVDGERSYFYPSIRLFRQKKHSDWKFVLECVTDALEEKIVCRNKIVAENCESANDWYNYGNFNLKRGCLEEAQKCYSKSLALDENFLHSWMNLAYVYYLRGEPEKSVSCYKRAAMFKQRLGDIYGSMAQAILISGDLHNGFKYYEWRMQATELKSSFLWYANTPLWRGENFAGKTLLVHSEQGFGDVFQFCRFLEPAKKRGGKIILAVRPSLRRLLVNCIGIDALIDYSEKGLSSVRYDLVSPLMSLPYIFGIGLKNIPNRIPYIFPERTSVLHWARKLESDKKFKVGIVWAGNPENKQGITRTCGFKAFKALLKFADVSFYSLQLGEPARELVTHDIEHRVIDLTGDIRDFLDTAALIMNLDLVISIDTSVPHLAAAVGKEVWTVLPEMREWRWLLKGKRTAWYPNMRLFRQQKTGDWTQVFEEVALALAKKLGLFGR